MGGNQGKEITSNTNSPKKRKTSKDKKSIPNAKSPEVFRVPKGASKDYVDTLPRGALFLNPNFPEDFSEDSMVAEDFQQQHNVMVSTPRAPAHSRPALRVEDDEETLSGTHIINNAEDAEGSHVFKRTQSKRHKDWFQANISKEECTEFLKDQKEGAFIIYVSKNDHFLALKHNSNVRHIPILMTPTNEFQLYIELKKGDKKRGPQPIFATLTDLVEHYKEPGKSNVGFFLSKDNPAFESKMDTMRRSQLLDATFFDPSGPGKIKRGGSHRTKDEIATFKPLLLQPSPQQSRRGANDPPNKDTKFLTVDETRLADNRKTKMFPLETDSDSNTATEVLRVLDFQLDYLEDAPPAPPPLSKGNSLESLTSVGEPVYGEASGTQALGPAQIERLNSYRNVKPPAGFTDASNNEGLYGSTNGSPVTQSKHQFKTYKVSLAPGDDHEQQPKGSSPKLRKPPQPGSRPPSTSSLDPSTQGNIINGASLLGLDSQRLSSNIRDSIASNIIAPPLEFASGPGLESNSTAIGSPSGTINNQDPSKPTIISASKTDQYEHVLFLMKEEPKKSTPAPLSQPSSINTVKTPETGSLKRPPPKHPPPLIPPPPKSPNRKEEGNGDLASSLSPSEPVKPPPPTSADINSDVEKFLISTLGRTRLDAPREDSPPVDEVGPPHSSPSLISSSTHPVFPTEMLRHGGASESDSRPTSLLIQPPREFSGDDTPNPPSAPLPQPSNPPPPTLPPRKRSVDDQSEDLRNRTSSLSFPSFPSENTSIPISFERSEQPLPTRLPEDLTVTETFDGLRKPERSPPRKSSDSDLESPREQSSERVHLKPMDSFQEEDMSASFAAGDSPIKDDDDEEQRGYEVPVNLGRYLGNDPNDVFEWARGVDPYLNPNQPPPLWLHYAKLSRNGSEKLLNSLGAAPGLFLVRERRAASGDLGRFALSVCMLTKIEHHLITMNVQNRTYWIAESQTVRPLSNIPDLHELIRRLQAPDALNLKYAVIIPRISQVSQGDLPEWYHGRISREEAKARLITRDLSNGRFLVRASSSKAGVTNFVLSVIYDGQIFHHLISFDGSTWLINKTKLGDGFSSLSNLIAALMIPRSDWDQRLISFVRPRPPYEKQQLPPYSRGRTHSLGNILSAPESAPPRKTSVDLLKSPSSSQLPPPSTPAPPPPGTGKRPPLLRADNSASKLTPMTSLDEYHPPPPPVPPNHPSISRQFSSIPPTDYYHSPPELPPRHDSFSVESSPPGSSSPKSAAKNFKKNPFGRHISEPSNLRMKDTRPLPPVPHLGDSPFPKFVPLDSHTGLPLPQIPSNSDGFGLNPFDSGTPPTQRKLLGKQVSSPALKPSSMDSPSLARRLLNPFSNNNSPSSSPTILQEIAHLNPFAGMRQQKSGSNLQQSAPPTKSDPKTPQPEVVYADANSLFATHEEMTGDSMKDLVFDGNVEETPPLYAPEVVEVLDVGVPENHIVTPMWDKMDIYNTPGVPERIDEA